MHVGRGIHLGLPSHHLLAFGVWVSGTSTFQVQGRAVLGGDLLYVLNINRKEIPPRRHRPSPDSDMVPARSFWVAAILWPLLLVSIASGQDSTATAPASTGAPSETIATAAPSATGPLESPLPSQVPLPPKQAWCPSEIFCAGEVSLGVNLQRA